MKKHVDLGVFKEPKKVSDCLSFEDWLDGREADDRTINFYEYYLIRQGVPRDEAQAEGRRLLEEYDSGQAEG